MRLLSSMLFAGLVLAETVTIQPGAKFHVYSGSGPTEKTVKALTKAPIELVPAAEADYLFHVQHRGINWVPTYTVRTWSNCRSCSTEVTIDEHKGKTGGEVFHGCEVIDLHTRKIVWESTMTPRDRAHGIQFPKSEAKCVEAFAQALGKPQTPSKFEYPVDSPLKENNWIKTFAK